jgi:hypothetical protein
VEDEGKEELEKEIIGQDMKGVVEDVVLIEGLSYDRGRWFIFRMELQGGGMSSL